MKDENKDINDELIWIELRKQSEQLETVYDRIKRKVAENPIVPIGININYYFILLWFNH
jgi:hypothetical protein